MAAGASAHRVDADADRPLPGSRFRVRRVRFWVLYVAATGVLIGLYLLRGLDGSRGVAAGGAALFVLTIMSTTLLVADQRRLAVTDGLTGLATRRFLESRLAAEVARTKRNGGSVGLILLDVDHFKLVNDRFGHPAGDRVLVELAERLRTAAPDGVLARFGGEEFALLIRQTDPEELIAVAERLRLGVAARPIPVGGDVRAPVTVSIGAATYPEHARDLHDLIGVVDSALYTAKDRGRDRVVVGNARRTTRSSGDVAGRMLEYLSFVAEDVDGRLSGHEHSSAISRWARTLAMEIGLDADEVRAAELAGRLHDVGKIVLPDDLLTKPVELSEAEWRVMAEHAEHGYRLTRPVPGLADVAEIIRQHHERYDGRGYPNHLHGERIRIEARIIAICDSWAAMRAERLYEGKLTADQAQSELLRGRGSQFDGTLVEVFLDLLHRDLVGDLRRLRPNPGMPGPQGDPAPHSPTELRGNGTAGIFPAAARAGMR